MLKTSPALLLFAASAVLTAFNLTPSQAVPIPPPWVTTICADASPCVLPTEVFAGLQLSIQWLEADGVTPCPPTPDDVHPQTTCGLDPQIRQWVALSRGGQSWLPAALDHVALVSQSAIYSGGAEPIGISEFGENGTYARGLVVSFVLPAPPPLQQGAVTVLTEAEVDIRIAAAVAAIPPGGLTQAQFDILLAGSPFGAFADPVTGHTHNRPDLTITRAQSLDGVTITLSPTGPPQ